MDFTALALIGKLILFGDSLSIGTNWFLKTEPAVTIGGRGSDLGWSEHTHRLVRSEDTLVVMLGTNDAAFWGRYGEIAYRDRLRTLITDMASKAKRVIWIGPPCSFARGWTSWLPEIDRMISQEIAAMNLSNVTYVSMIPHTSRPDGSCATEGRASDGIHFTRAGYQRLANFVIENIR